ncbi:MAG: hypothetical protein VX941_11165 [Pseudomonadota bacterium]|nr:hypothetical protein [Pseudomonadota bacterium]
MNLAERMNCAILLADQKDFVGADAVCEEICVALPDQPDGYYLRGLIAFRSGLLERALQYLTQAEILGSTEVGLKRSLALILLSQADYYGAMVRYRDIAAQGDLDRQDALPLAQLGEALRDEGAIGLAMEFFAHSRSLDSKNNPATVGLFLCAQLTCDWREIDALEKEVEALTQVALTDGMVPVESPFVHVTRVMDSEKNYAVARAWSNSLKIDGIERSHKRSTKDPIRLAYISSDFHEHATAYLIHHLFKLHDKQRFEVFAYSCDSPSDSSLRREIESNCDFFFDITEWSADKAAQHISKNGIDILIDLKGHTRKNRLDIAARRPAPLQVTYLGFPGSSGADFFDYVVADPIVLPKADWKFYSESPILLPHCYQINSHTDKPLVMTKREAGLPEEVFVFCSFANTYKIDPLMFSTWMRVLGAVKDSVLWLCANNSLAESNLKRVAHEHGIAPHRLIFAPFVNQETHLMRLSAADLALDTRIYNGHTTTSDALWAGVPVLTLKGMHFASRVSESILHAIGLDELVVDGLDAFEVAAIELAEKTGKIDTIKARIADLRNVAPLFDTVGFVHDFERGLAEIHQKRMLGEMPSPVIL